MEYMRAFKKTSQINGVNCRNTEVKKRELFGPIRSFLPALAE
jgi:hypothetical protein